MTSDPSGLPTDRELYDEAACGLAVTDTDGTIRKVNETLCRWLGYEAQSLVGVRKIQELLTMGGRIFHQTHWAPLLQMQGSVAEVKLEFRHRDGHTIPVMLNALKRTRPTGSFHELAIVVAEDRHKYERELLRERKRAESSLATQLEAEAARALAETRLRVAVEAAQLHVWDYVAATGQHGFDDSAALLLGYSEPQVMALDDVIEAIEPADRPIEKDAWFAAQRLSSADYRVVYRLNGVDGRQRVVLAMGRGVFDSDGRFERFIGILQDITELSRQRDAAEDRAVFAEQMMGIVSHDLRNPLATIFMSADLLAKGEELPARRRYIQFITEAATRAQRLIADLLDFTVARIGSGIAVTITPVDWHALVSRCVDALRLSFPNAVLVHRTEGAGLCSVDSDRVTQLIGNLVANATAYGSPGSPITVISAIEVATCSVSVHNEGTPIPNERIEHLFKPMVRGDHVSTGSRSVGLGLFIVREIVTAHGGDIRVESTPKGGTTFSAQFPR